MLRKSRLLIIAVAVVGCGGKNGDDKCGAGDADGVMGGNVPLDVRIFDDHVEPILSAQNNANVTLTVHNMGTKPHDFVIDCIPTPNEDGCPMTSCFPMSAKTDPLDPGASATVMFVVPLVEDIYYYHSDLPGDVAGPCGPNVTGCGQFIVK
jgi:hypothetical protein